MLSFSQLTGHNAESNGTRDGQEVLWVHHFFYIILLDLDLDRDRVRVVVASHVIDCHVLAFLPQTPPPGTPHLRVRPHQVASTLTRSGSTTLKSFLKYIIQTSTTTSLGTIDDYIMSKQ